MQKPKIKPARHHWWPECVSEFWKNPEGRVHWLLPNGDVRVAPPGQFGSIRNGHTIKLGKPGEETDWDESFEKVFDKADSAFPYVIQWLQGLERAAKSDAKTIGERYKALEADDSQIADLVECLVSMAVRSPLHRADSVRAAEAVRRDPIPQREREALIGLNMRNSQKQAVNLIGVRGKFVVFYSPSREFIFGDGFCHNIRSPVQFSLHEPKILLPVTPEITVLFCRPRQYLEAPRLFSVVLDEKETGLFNDVVQVYAKECLLYRSQKPEIREAYAQGQHLGSDFVDQIIATVPGVRNAGPFGF